MHGLFVRRNHYFGRNVSLHNVMSNSRGGPIRFVLGFSTAIDQRVDEDDDSKVVRMPTNNRDKELNGEAP